MTQVSKPPPDRLKQLIWVYFWLLIFEGALRKWLFPQYTSIFLVIRDPIAVLIYALAIFQGRFRWNHFITALGALGIISFVISLFVLQLGSFRHTFLISGYGFRANFLHLPLLFLIGSVLQPEDVKKIGKWLLILAIPMAVLVFLQYQAPLDSFLNKGSLGSESKQIEAAVEGVGKIRPPGVFAFTTGLSFFIAAVAAYLLYAALEKNAYSWWLSLMAAVACCLMIGFSISRTTVMGVVVVLVALLICCVVRPKLLKRALIPLAVVAVMIVVVSSWSAFSESLEIIGARFAGAGVKEGIFVRFMNGFSDPLKVVTQTPLFGYGLGLGTNGGISMLGLLGVLSLGEAEWTRVIREVGPVLGISYLALRVILALSIGAKAIRSSIAGNALPLLLFGVSALLLVNGQFGQTTTLGFAVFISGLSLAAAKEEREPVFEETPASFLSRNLLKGRSAYAEALHHS
jgi:hypothetical protein